MAVTVCAGRCEAGELFATLEGGHLTGLAFDTQLQKGALVQDESALCEADRAVFNKVLYWLSSYFAGRILPIDNIPISLRGSAFQQAVWQELMKIPAGKTVTYGELAQNIERTRGRRVSARAVGGAVGKNPLSILLPCHRVLGAGGALTGYTGGLDKKSWLLRREGWIIKGKKVLPRA